MKSLKTIAASAASSASSQIRRRGIVGYVVKSKARSAPDTFTSSNISLDAAEAAGWPSSIPGTFDHGGGEGHQVARSVNQAECGGAAWAGLS